MFHVCPCDGLRDRLLSNFPGVARPRRPSPGPAKLRQDYRPSNVEAKSQVIFPPGYVRGSADVSIYLNPYSLPVMQPQPT
jgi:hypothetical protein